MHRFRLKDVRRLLELTRPHRWLLQRLRRARRGDGPDLLRRMLHLVVVLLLLLVLGLAMHRLKKLVVLMLPMLRLLLLWLMLLQGTRANGKRCW